jgi:predicted DNA-binding transcriptional regulator AlpA
MSQEKGNESERMESKYMRAREVAYETGRSERQLWRDLQNGSIPKPFKQGRSTYWIRAEILAHMEKLEQNRSN